VLVALPYTKRKGASLRLVLFVEEVMLMLLPWFFICIPKRSKQIHSILSTHESRIEIIVSLFHLPSFPLLPLLYCIDKRHGDPSDKEHMAGDLGNITVDESGTATIDLPSPDQPTNNTSSVQLLGPHSVIGRSIVVYAGEDDRGRGGHENSLQTGNPGPRIAAGVIGLSL
jgi:Cu-Zn family superoxide dismutase